MPLTVPPGRFKGLSNRCKDPELGYEKYRNTLQVLDLAALQGQAQQHCRRTHFCSRDFSAKIDARLFGRSKRQGFLKVERKKFA